MGRQLEYPYVGQKVSTETGEVVSEFAMKENEDLKPYVEPTPQQKRYQNELDEMRGYNAALGGFVAMYYNNLLYNKQLDLDLATISRCIYLATYMDFNTNVLVLNGGYASGKKIIPMKKKDIREAMNLSKEGFRLFFKSITENGILIQNEDKTFSMSNKYFAKGGNIDKKQEFTRVYVDVVRELYQNCKSSQHKTLAYAFKLISKMDMESNLIVHNPNDKYNDLKKMTLTEIGEFLGVDTEKGNLNKFKNNLYQIIINRDGKKYYIFKKITIESGAGQNGCFAVNPMLFYRGNSYPKALSTIQELLING